MTSRYAQGFTILECLLVVGILGLLIGVLLLVALFAYHSTTAVAWLLGMIIAVAAYGSFTSSPWIILKQGGLAIIALVLVLVFGL